MSEQMTPQQVTAMRTMADNLRSEGRTSRADNVLELCDAINSLQQQNAALVSQLEAALRSASELTQRVKGLEYDPQDERAAKLISKCDEHRDFISGDDGYIVYWPAMRHGALGSWGLRVIAQELDQRNKEWDERSQQFEKEKKL